MKSIKVYMLIVGIIVIGVILGIFIVSNNSYLKDENTVNNGTNTIKENEPAKEEKIDIIGNWKPYQAQENGKNVELMEIYGSAFSTYGGYLVLNEDGTYTKFIGVYSVEEENDLQGTYIVKEDELELTSYNKEKEVENLKIIKDNNEHIIQEETNGYTIFYRRETTSSNASKETNYSLRSNYIGEWSDEDNINNISIKTIKENTFSFDLSIFRTYLYQNLTATMTSDTTATFDTNDNDDAGDTWKGVYGTIKFEEDEITLRITESNCEYINSGVEYIYKKIQ